MAKQEKKVNPKFTARMHARNFMLAGVLEICLLLLHTEEPVRGGSVWEGDCKTAGLGLG